MTTPMIRSWAVAAVLSLVAAGVNVPPTIAQPQGKGKGQGARGPAITVTPLMLRQTDTALAFELDGKLVLGG